MSYTRHGRRDGLRKWASISPVHEFSIAEALAAQVLAHAPAGARVREIEIVVGALRGLEPDALRMCWDAVTFGTPMAGSTLQVDLRPWSIRCSSCGRGWASPVPFVSCLCGNSTPAPMGGDELDLVAITVDEVEV
jgi:hydrogenase nickel incorporation protein HypA/HybF